MMSFNFFWWPKKLQIYAVCIIISIYENTVGPFSYDVIIFNKRKLKFLCKVYLSFWREKKNNGKKGVVDPNRNFLKPKKWLRDVNYIKMSQMGTITGEFLLM